MSTEKKVSIGILIFGIVLFFGGIAGYNSASDEAAKFEKEGTTVQATVSNAKCEEVAYKVVVTDGSGEAKKDLLGFEKTKTEYRTQCSYDYTYTYNGQSYTKSDSMEGKISNGATFMVGINKNDPGKLMTIPAKQTKGGLIFTIVLGLFFIVGGGFAIAKTN